MVPKVTGAPYLKKRAKVMVWPAFWDSPTTMTLAEAPMGVAMPPMSVPLDTAQVRVCRSMPKVSARDRSTGTITVEIDDEDLPPVAFDDKTLVKLTGEVDKGLLQREVDVDRLEITQ